MKAIKLIIIVAFLFPIINHVQAQPFKVKNQKVTIKGTSSLHDWESVAESIECKGTYTLINNELTEVKDVSLKVKVDGIKSPKGKTMDNKTYEAFKYEKHPYIIFVLHTVKIDEVHSVMNLNADLTMAGVTKPITIKSNYQILPGGELRITGSKKLMMTDYNMVPPTAMMGTIKVGDEVEVIFDMTLNNNKVL